MKENDSILYTSKQLAELLDVSLEWLRLNRKAIGKDRIPFKARSYRTVLYDKYELLEWFGRKDLEFKFYSTRSLSEKIGLPVSWIKKNRYLDNPIPFRIIAGLLRYNETEVQKWLKNFNNKGG